MLIDYANNPPAKQFADEHIVEDAFNIDIVYRISKDKSANLIISVAADTANLVAVRTAEMLNLPRPYSYKNAVQSSDKNTMKRKLINNNIPTSNYVRLASIEELHDYNYEYPIVAKPSHGYGSKGVRLISDEKDLRAFTSKAFASSLDKKVLVEQFTEGIELNVYSYIHDGSVQVLSLSEKVRINATKEAVLQSAGSISPARVSSEVHELIQKTIQKIADAFQFKNTVLLTQLIVKPNNEISILELTPRVGGGVGFKIVESLTGIDIIDVMVDCFLNKNKALTVQTKDVKIAVINIYAKPSVINMVVGLDGLLKENIITEYYLNRTRGDQTSPNYSSSDRIAMVLIKDDTYKGLLDKVQSTIKRVEVKDINNEQVFDNEIYKRFH